MKRSLLAVVAALVVVAGPAQAQLVDLTASPNPANVGNQVRHTVSLGAPTRLELYVSARQGSSDTAPGRCRRARGRTGVARRRPRELRPGTTARTPA